MWWNRQGYKWSEESPIVRWRMPKLTVKFEWSSSPSGSEIAVFGPMWNGVPVLETHIYDGIILTEISEDIRLVSQRPTEVLQYAKYSLCYFHLNNLTSFSNSTLLEQKHAPHSTHFKRWESQCITEKLRKTMPHNNAKQGHNSATAQ
jgi:hypothetical protein